MSGFNPSGSLAALIFGLTRPIRVRLRYGSQVRSTELHGASAQQLLTALSVSLHAGRSVHMMNTFQFISLVGGAGAPEGNKGNEAYETVRPSALCFLCYLLFRNLMRALCAARRANAASRAPTSRWRSRSCRRHSCFLFFPFHSARFLFRLLDFGQWPKLHDSCLHRAIRHFVIRTPRFLVSNHVFHRRGLATLGDNGFVGNLQDTRIFFTGDRERLRFVIYCGNHAFERSSPHLAASRCC